MDLLCLALSTCICTWIHLCTNLSLLIFYIIMKLIKDGDVRRVLQTAVKLIETCTWVSFNYLDATSSVKVPFINFSRNGERFAMLLKQSCNPFHCHTLRIMYYVWCVSKDVYFIKLCFSYRGCKTIGYDKTKHSIPVEIDGMCTSSKSMLHILFHLLGRYHEHQRVDKDKYVRVLNENILQGMKLFVYNMIVLHVIR